MDTVTVQDSQRETNLAKLFDLKLSDSRIYEDATDKIGNFYELKTTTKNVVSTARDFGPKHIEKWKKRYWIIARGNNLSSGFTFDSIYFLSRCHMDGWYDRHSDYFDDGHTLINKIIDHIPDDLRMTATKYMKRGLLLNDPGISWSYVTDNGIKIDKHHSETLRDLVEKYPLTCEHEPGDIFFWKGRYL